MLDRSNMERVVIQGEIVSVDCLSSGSVGSMTLCCCWLLDIFLRRRRERKMSEGGLRGIDGHGIVI